MIILEIKHLRKVYPRCVAVDDVSLKIFAGEIFGLVGPNGAGKTTLIECLEGLRPPDSGQVLIKGMDPFTQGYALRPHLGIQLQDSSLPDRLKVWEALELFASFYPHTTDLNDLMEQLGLAAHRQVYFGKLSGGLKQRLFVALALLHDPEVIFLDELTTGLDPQARHAIWDLVRQIRSRGKTIFLTTHSMEEAEKLCDRLAIIDHGRIIALDTPENLIRSIGGESKVVFTSKESLPLERLAGLTGVSRIETKGKDIVVYGSESPMVKELINFLTAQSFDFSNFQIQKPNLEDVFLTLTGREIRN